ncbi:MAG: hypothetical protein ABFD49_07750 [Armatimonadota bacterium]|nr:hypothetical protein [bacterium]
MNILKIYVVLLGAAVISPVCAQATTWNGQGFTVVASSIGGSPAADKTFKIVADKNVYFKTIDQAAGTFLEAESSKLTVLTMPSAGTTGSVKSAELSGPVKLVYTTCDPKTNARSTMTATSDSATYDGVTQVAYLIGNVKIVNDNPTLFAQPAVMTGDKATINLKPGAGTEFRVESSPGLSRIEATPKNQEATKK